MKLLTDFPIKLISDNLTFGRDGTVWAYYEIPGFGYDHRDFDQKKEPFYKQMNFLTKNVLDLHYLLIPYRMDGLDIIKRTTQDVKRKNYLLKENGLGYLDTVAQAMRRGDLNQNSNQYHSYFGVQLDPEKNRFSDHNAGVQFITGVKGFMEGLASPMRFAAGLDPYDIPKEVIEAYKVQSKELAEEVSAMFQSEARELTAAETGGIVEYGFTLSTENGHVEKREFGFDVTGKDRQGNVVRAVRPNKKSYYDLHNSEVVLKDADTTPHNIKLRKVVDEEVQEQFVQYLIVDRMEPENEHPAFEWMYRLQNQLPFAIGVSVRAYHKSTKRVRKEVSGALLGYEDQRKQNQKMRVEELDSATKEKEAGAKSMDHRFQKTGYPAYTASFVIRVTGANRSELKTRINTVTRELATFGISVKSPYGDSMKYFGEFIPTAPRQSADYWIHAEPGALAAMMFGATTNIGDGRGFPIGFTKKLQKQVYIQPDLAAKDFEHVKNKTKSLSVMVAGETGFGKSLFMNLFSMLSALTNGSQVLIIDPKGDRKKWADGLPFIPKEFISIWTLGEDPRDAGSLDPFRTTINTREAKSIAINLLGYLTNAKFGADNNKYALLSEAVQVAGDHDDPCVGAVIDHLKKLQNTKPERLTVDHMRDLNNLIGTLDSIKVNPLAELLFGEIGQNYKTLKVDKPMQILMVENLTVPQKGAVEKSISETVSEAILISLTAFTKQFIFKTDRKKHKVISMDEVATLENSSMGRSMIDWVERNGRYFNTTLLKATQGATDYDSANRIGMKFCFQLPQREEAERMLSFMNLPITENNVQSLQNLQEGECMFQDIYGRTAIISINTIFEDILDAFDTSTSDKEEREQEAKRMELEV